MSIQPLIAAVTKNRAEEFGQDVWRHFVVPLFYDELDLDGMMKPRVIVGGRGCGKTMLLRYLSHQSQFSIERSNIDKDEVLRIGLYWKADIQFCRAMTGRGLEKETWQSAFEHEIAVVTGLDLLRCLKSIAESNCPAIKSEELTTFDFSALSAYGLPRLVGVDDAIRALEERDRVFRLWVNNPRKIEEPIFLPGRSFVISLIEELKRQHHAIGGSVYFVYIDEYENLYEYQQQLVNSMIKGSEIPLIFNIAMKRNGMRTKQTVGEEHIQEPADYRTYDLDALGSDLFKVFAAEVLFQRFAMSDAPIPNLPIDVSVLRSRSDLRKRRTEEYQRAVESMAENLLPSFSGDELARHVLSQKAIADALRRDIVAALHARNSSLSPDRFNVDSQPRAMIVVPALLRRDRLTPQVVLDELEKLAHGEASKFSHPTDWIHNNFIGSLLRLYRPFSRPCPLYSGFNTFILLAGGNLRHFLELCHNSLKSVEEQDRTQLPEISPEAQAIAAHEASVQFLSEIRTFGPFGNKLRTFVLTLGKLFALAHQRPTQSEPEVNHFSLSGGSDAAFTDEMVVFLSEAVKWSVLQEFSETKVKDGLMPKDSEYLLNRIYAPYFCITYRKMRRLDLSVGDFAVLMSGTKDDRARLLKKKAAEWSIEKHDAETTLFPL